MNFELEHIESMSASLTFEPAEIAAVDTSDKAYFCGLDLGQSKDYTALTVLERTGKTADTYKFDCRFLKRWELRTGFPEIVEDVVQMMNSPTLSGGKNRSVLAIDQTGLGAPVVDLFRRAAMKSILVPVHITGGATVTRDNDVRNVPKRILVAVTSIALQTGKLKISEKLPLAQTLTSELENFKATISDSGNDSYGAGSDWRVGNNDDLVLALAMALWAGNNIGTSIGVFV